MKRDILIISSLALCAFLFGMGASALNHRHPAAAEDVRERPLDVLVIGSVTNTFIPRDPMWVPIAGLRETLTLSNPVVRVVIKMDRNKMITTELEPDRR